MEPGGIEPPTSCMPWAKSICQVGEGNLSEIIALTLRVVGMVGSSTQTHGEKQWHTQKQQQTHSHHLPNST